MTQKQTSGVDFKISRRMTAVLTNRDLSIRIEFWVTIHSQHGGETRAC